MIISKGVEIALGIEEGTICVCPLCRKHYKKEDQARFIMSGTYRDWADTETVSGCKECITEVVTHLNDYLVEKATLREEIEKEIMKNVKIKDKDDLTVRFEVYDVSNHRNLGSPYLLESLPSYEKAEEFIRLNIKKEQTLHIHKVFIKGESL